METMARHRRSVAALTLLAAALPGVTGAQPAASPAADTAGEWRSPGRDPGLTRYSPLDQINSRNVAGLRATWSFATGSLRGHEGNPLVVGATLYVHTPYPNQVFALDLLRPGAPIKWRYAAPPPPGTRTPPAIPLGCCDLGSRGLGYHESGKLYVPLLTGELAALDAATGREIWRVRNSDFRAGATLPGAPLVARDLVIVGGSGAEQGVRGQLTAYDALTGRQVWRGWSTGPDTDLLLDGPANPAYPSHQARDLGVTSWLGQQWRTGGGTASGWLSYDPALDLVFYGTDQPAPPNPQARPGDNKWTASLMARSRATGKVRWALQLTPHDQWGYGAANENILVDLTVRGNPVKALVHFDRNGFAYTIDRASGRVLLAEKYGPANWASRVDPGSALPVLDPKYGGLGTDICPGGIGMKFLQPAAFSPLTNLFYVPLNNLCMDLEVRPGAAAPVPRMKPGPGRNRGRFIAWDAATATIAWEIREPLAVASGALATAGGLVFYGTLDGWLKALDQRTGQELWKYKTPSGILGSPIAFLGPDGKQYLAVLSGGGGWWGLGGQGAFTDLASMVNPGGTLTVFGL
ncbi:MAG: PQQ-dependent dehydrogenase, methanol/ethanol family [Gemmatimonadales bacterium]